MSRLSRCMGCTGYVHHTEDEDVNERTLCDKCLAELKLPPRGTHKAWRESSVDAHAWLAKVDKLVDAEMEKRA